jgi:pyrimidine operon attenuation protein/uracil phosphoribosyltransferase
MPDAIDINALIEEMADQISSENLDNPALIGIHTGGVWVAQKLHSTLGLKEPLGSLDISFYRDDFSRVGLNPEVRSSELPMEIENRNIVLIDDVLYTGRTIRAALNEIFSYGRPSIVRLGVLINRPGHELPVQADYTGQTLELTSSQQAKLANDNGTLSLNIIDTSAKV